MKRVALIAAAIAIVGCGGGGDIDADQLEAEITKNAEERGIVLDAVDCPSPDTEQGAAFTCTVTVKGQDTELDVLQVDDDGQVSYNFTGLVEGPAVNDIAADRTSIEAVIDAVNRDVTALCDHATPEFREEISGKENCAKAVLADYDSPLLEDYKISVNADTAAASADGDTVTLERQKDGSWLITDVR
jgi:uncharacterized protein DUF4333